MGSVSRFGDMLPIFIIQKGRKYISHEQDHLEIKVTCIIPFAVQPFQGFIQEEAGGRFS